MKDTILVNNGIVTAVIRNAEKPEKFEGKGQVFIVDSKDQVCANQLWQGSKAIDPPKEPEQPKQPKKSLVETIREVVLEELAKLPK